MTDQELIQTIVAAYALSHEDIQRLGKGIESAYLASFQASYRAAQHVVGVSANWTPGKRLTTQAGQRSEKTAQGIAETYQGLLTSALEQLLHIKGWRDLYETATQAIHALIGSVSTWLATFLPWKTQQIANATCGAGGSDATVAFVEDVLTAQNTEDGQVTDEEGNILWALEDMTANVADIRIIILPGEASNDVCRTIAGQSFTLEEYGDMIDLIGGFPVHPNCIHYSEVITV